MAEFLTNFALDAQSVTLSLTTIAQSIKLAEKSRSDVLLTNLSNQLMWIQTGPSDVVATQNSVPLLPGEKGVYSRGLKSATPATHLSARTDVGAGSLVVVPGMGV